MSDGQHDGDAQFCQSERDALALKDLLKDARHPGDADRVRISVIETLDGIIEQLRRQSRAIEAVRSDMAHKQGIVTRIGGGQYNDNRLTGALKEFGSSSNGDRWLLGRDEETGFAYVVHKANQPSGGATVRRDIRDFLTAGPAAPEHDALIRLIGTLVDTD